MQESKPKKVLFFANTDWYLYNFRLGLARYLAAAGVDVAMMSPPGPYGARIREAGFRWLPLPMDRRSLNVATELKLFGKILDVFRTEKPDLVHNFTIKCVVYGSLAARRLKIGRRINAVTGLGHVFIDDSFRAKLLRAPVKLLLRLALGGSQSRLIVQNPDDERLFTELGMIGRDRIRLIRGSGVDTERFAPVRRGSTGNSQRVLLASRLLREKGILEFVHAAREIRSRSDRVEFLLAGLPDSGNPSSVPEQLIAQWEKEGVVRVLGHVDDMALLLRTIDVVVLPSYREGAPRSLIEAAAMGLPLIATDVPGCREVVEDGINGFLVPVKDSEALRSKLAYLLANPGVCRRFGAAGRKKVLDELDERIVLAQTDGVYREIGM